MKKLAIFDNCYENCYDLEKDVNNWIEENNIDVIDIKLQTLNEEEYIKDDFDHRSGEPIKVIEKAIFWVATVIYEEK